MDIEAKGLLSAGDRIILEELAQLRSILERDPFHADPEDSLGSWWAEKLRSLEAMQGPYWHITIQAPDSKAGFKSGVTLWRNGVARAKSFSEARRIIAEIEREEAEGSET